jgi:hypothetical protein
MTPQEMDEVKSSLKRLHEGTKEIWLEKVLLWNLILDSGWMNERDLALAIAQGKAHPENIRQTEEHFATDEHRLAEIGIADWLAEFGKDYPRTD